MFGSTGTSVAQEYDGAASCLPCSSSTTADTALARCFLHSGGFTRPADNSECYYSGNTWSATSGLQSALNYLLLKTIKRNAWIYSEQTILTSISVFTSEEKQAMLSKLYRSGSGQLGCVTVAVP